jgi:MerR family transcriptional regulator, Zn(II)-responsive regulator of zntA
LKINSQELQTLTNPILEMIAIEPLGNNSNSTFLNNIKGNSMIVSELAKRAGVTAETVRYYTRSGLLKPKQQSKNGYHNYSDNDLARLIFVRKARVLGFGLNEIAEILQMGEHGHSPCPRVREILDERLQDTRQKLKELKTLQLTMERAAKKWAEMPNGTPNGDAVCNLIEAIGYPD